MARISTSYYILSLVILIIASLASIQPVNAQDEKDFIVTLQSAKAEGHYEWMRTKQGKMTCRMGTDAAKEAGKDVLKTFSIGKMKGYAATLSESWVKSVLKTRSEVKSVEIDGKVQIQAPLNITSSSLLKRQSDITTAKDPQINLDMMDTTGNPLFDKSFSFPSEAGKGVKVFVVDTGVLATHTQFEGRAKMAASICKGCPNTDDNGHGTHVSGIVAGKSFGVARKANILGVKVLNAKGAGANSDVIAGLQFVGDEKKKDKKGIFVVNMSLGGGKVQAVNDAVKALTDQGVHVMVAAGNEAQDACNTSPASESSAFTVGAVEDTSLTITDFSNFGSCVKGFAPGRNIQSCGIKNNNDIAVFSGTSQATPHVAGVAALALSKMGDMKPADLNKLLQKDALSGKMTFLAGTEKGSPNLFVDVNKL